MPKKSKPAKQRPQRARPQIGARAQAPLYKQKPPTERGVHAASTTTSPTTLKRPKVRAPNNDFVQATPLPAAPFELREDGSIVPAAPSTRPSPPVGEKVVEDRMRGNAPQLIYTSDTPFVRLYHGNCLELLDAIAAKYPDGRFDAIFADPPYFLSNGGITCHAGKMVRVDKGDWDKSRGPELNHEFNLE